MSYTLGRNIWTCPRILSHVMESVSVAAEIAPTS